MKCKICNRQSKSLFCSQECKDDFFVQELKLKKKEPKIKKQKLRFCKCGKLLKKSEHKCIDCKLEKFHKRYEYGVMGKCINCGGDVICQINRKYIKRYCSHECAKQYIYNLAKSKKI